jgi:hypothetical protein
VGRGTSAWCKSRGLYIGKYHPRGGEYQPMSFGGKIWKSKEKKGENVKEKEERGKKKEESGKKKEEWIVLSINVKYLIMISLDCPF